MISHSRYDEGIADMLGVEVDYYIEVSKIMRVSELSYISYAYVSHRQHMVKIAIEIFKRYDT